MNVSMGYWLLLNVLKNDLFLIDLYKERKNVWLVGVKRLLKFLLNLRVFLLFGFR